MNPSVSALFQYTRSRVTERDIFEFSPSDPGYPDYVTLWTKIWCSGVIPERTEFDLSEVIGLTGWSKPDEEKDPERFRCYRRFTTSVGIALLHSGNASEIVRPSNYLARDLIIDLDQNSQTHFTLIREVASVTREVLLADGFEDGYPFFTFAAMILAQTALDWPCAEAAASQLILDEGAVRASGSQGWWIWDDRFLLGLTAYDRHHTDWVAFAKELSNPNSHEDTQLVIDALKSVKIKSRR